MNYVKINGISFDATVAISSIEENFNVLDGDNVGRNSGNGRMIRDVLGSFIGHKITFFNGKDNAAFDALWDYLKQHSADDYVMLEAASGQSSISYQAYYTSGSRKLRTAAEGVNYWDEIEVNFIPIAPQIVR
ncbi:hypothetical protein [Oscillibacter sp.]|uniref:hypothetical protein n=1 Tax=Oscillibacter sp. TaxID=1945593 RepID=UPI0028A23954|nr:hypothetical protein [Oscillibacter sp.]